MDNEWLSEFHNADAIFVGHAKAKQWRGQGGLEGMNPSLEGDTGLGGLRRLAPR